jgi:hypothetical protein
MGTIDHASQIFYGRFRALVLLPLNVLIPVTDVIQVVVTLSHWIVPDSMGYSTDCGPL